MKFKSSSGLTLAELIIGLAVIMILGLISSLYLINLRRSRSLHADTSSIKAVLRDAQQRAISQDSIAAGEHWGVHFDNINGPTPFYEMFKGSDYPGQRFSKFLIRSQVTFCKPVLGATFNVFFDNNTGIPGDKNGAPWVNEEYIDLRLRGNPNEAVSVKVDINGVIDSVSPGVCH